MSNGQNLSVEPKRLIAGGEATVTVTGATPNTTVTVQIDDGIEGGQTSSVDIEVGANGEGSAQWEVLPWDLAVFRWGDTQPITRFIDSLDPT